MTLSTPITTQRPGRGSGITATLDLYVNGTFRQALNVNSKQTWLYEGGSNNYNGNDQNPADGATAAATPAAAPVPTVTTTDATPDSGTAWVPPGQAKKADDASTGDDNRGQGRSKDR